MMAGTPGNVSARHSGERRPNRPYPARDFERIPAHKIALGVGLVEFLAHDAAAHGTLVPVERFFEDSLHHGIGVKHQVVSNQTTAVG